MLTKTLMTMIKTASFKTIVYSIFLAFSLAALSACSSLIKPQDIKTASAQANKNTPVITAVDLGAFKSLNSILPELATYKAVLVGEIHTRYADHLNQLAVIKGLHQRWGKMAIGLEMIQQPYQKALDDYIAGRINEHDMLRRTQWYDRWKYDFRLYRPIFRYAKKNNIPLVALNVPAEITKRITKVGIRGLTTKERAQLPKTLDKSNPAYTARLKKVFGSHMKTSSKHFAQFLEAQLAWDEGMAASAARYLKTHPGQRMVIIAGGGHIINREGIPARLQRRIKTKPAVVLNNVEGTPSPTLGDFLLFSSDAKLPPAGKLGIAMNESKAKNGVIVSLVQAHSAAAKAGIQKGDKIVRLGKMPIRASEDVLLWALDKKPGDSVKAVLKRDKQVLTKTIILRKARPMGMSGMSFKMHPTGFKHSKHAKKHSR